MKNTLIVIGVLLAIGAGYLISRKYKFNIEEKGRVMTPTVAVSESPSVTPKVGADVDEFGCKASAGYSWCETKKKCIREWEEPCDDQEAIAQALAQKNGWNTNDIVVTISKFNGKFARGLVNSKSEGGGGIYWAAKVDGKWQIAQDGNGIPDCNVLKNTFEFPKDFLTGTCD